MPRFLTKSHTEQFVSDSLTYTVNTGGSIDPFNEEISLANTGMCPFVNPVITVDGRFNWTSVEAMAAEITMGCESDEEKALAIFNWVRSHGDHQYSGDIQALNPVLLFNVFGYGICAYFASAQTGIAQAAGLRARVWEIYRHTVGEIYYDGAWHMLDPDMQLFFLNPDNRTIASVDQLEKGLDFFTRTQAYQRTFEDAHGRIRHEHQSEPDTFRYDIKHPRFEQHDYDPHIFNNWRMDYTLIPDETMVRRWQGSGKHNDYRNLSRFELNEEEPHKTWPPVQTGNGYVRYRPQSWTTALSNLVNENLAVTPAGCVVDLPQDSVNGARSQLRYSRPLPYLLVGGQIKGTTFREGASAFDSASITGFKHTPLERHLQLFEQDHPGRQSFDIDVDDFLYPEQDQYAYGFDVRVNLSRFSGHVPAAHTGISDLEVLTEFQVQPRSLPALKLGENTVSLDLGGPSGSDPKGEITHVWTERHGYPESKPPRPIQPTGSIEMDGGGVLFRWKRAAADTKSYQFQLSLHHRCAFPISPNFDVDLKSDATECAMDESWLNENTDYYWRVRGLSAQDIWSSWSKIHTFVAEPRPRPPG